MTIFELNILWITIAPSYYWLMYALWFIFWYLIILNRWLISKDRLDDLFMFIFVGVVLWWRLWYVFFYNPLLYINDPLSIFKVWEWWMSFHWGVIGVIIAMILFSRRFKEDFLKVADQVTLVLPIGLWLWRIWNYLNNELLWYQWYNWFMHVNLNWLTYFPSTLVEALLEWLVLFVILNSIYYYNKKSEKKNIVSKWQIAALFLTLYWIFRLIVEIFFRQPDAHIWYILWFFTMWELLSIPMVIMWLILFFRFKK